MSVRYVNFSHFKRGVPNDNPNSKAKYRNCMHCGSRAHWTAEQKNNKFVLSVRLCEEHKLVADEINERRS
jgi:hypothetical protein